MYSRFLYSTIGTPDLISQIVELGNNHRIVRVVIFGSAEDQESYVSEMSILSQSLSSVDFVWSYVPQPPFEATLAAEVWWIKDESKWFIERRECQGVNYLSMQRDGVKRLLVGGLNASEASSKIYTQSRVICDQISTILEREGMPIDSIIRQWNYIERITFEDAENQHYQEFNDARSELYSKVGWESGYPAATGIGALSGGVTIDFDASIGEEVTPIDNNLQVAAHAYSEEVLIGEQSQKTTPKFERAKLLEDILYVSGTAAIRGEESLVGISAAEQTRITLENIDVLLKAAGCGRATSLRVYIKYREDYPQIREVVEAYAPNDAIYVYADICREELLMEIEAVAYRE